MYLNQNNCNVDSSSDRVISKVTCQDLRASQVYQVMIILEILQVEVDRHTTTTALISRILKME